MGGRVGTLAWLRLEAEAAPAEDELNTTLVFGETLGIGSDGAPSEFDLAAGGDAMNGVFGSSRIPIFLSCCRI